MRWTEFLWLILPFLLSAFLTSRVRTYALSRGVLDVPNARSSHTSPTPRGGGLAVVATAVVALAVLGVTGQIDPAIVFALGAGGSAVAIIGYIDDRRGLGVLPRLMVHVGAAVLAVWLLSAQASEALPRSTMLAGIVLLLLSLGVVWSINLFNFMDGIDGIAASQAVFVTLASAVLVRSTSASAPDWIVLTMSAGACSGFLVWNWPPAKIFLGDVGSGFLGFWIAALAIAMHLSDALHIWASVALNSAFFADSTVTLVRRALRGDRWYEAHRSHAYQILARRWTSHFRVTILVWLVNIAIVLPAAFMAILWESVSMWIALALILIFALACAALGAGAPESRPASTAMTRS